MIQVDVRTDTATKNTVAFEGTAFESQSPDVTWSLQRQRFGQPTGSIIIAKHRNGWDHCVVIHANRQTLEQLENAIKLVLQNMT